MKTADILASLKQAEFDMAKCLAARPSDWLVRHMGKVFQKKMICLYSKLPELISLYASLASRKR